MRFSKYFIPTHKEVPADAEVISHQLMIRAGMIRKLTSGIYTYLPTGLRSIKKVEKIVREEMDRAGALELLMPAVQPAELWQESGRWDYYGKELLRFKDRHNRDACLGPTHEEVITDLVRKEIHSYKQMPVNFYQIQTKFRDEIRPRFGIMRGREFIMKDAYSFDVDGDNANASYEKMFEAYSKIFERCGLKFRAVEADTGSIGGNYSHEFMVLAETGEDQIINCAECSYAANLERAEVLCEEDTSDAVSHGEMGLLEEVQTPGMKTVEEVTGFLNITADRLVKTLILIVDGKEEVAVLVRGDHELNEAKLKTLLGAQTVDMAPETVVREITEAPVGFAGPAGLKIRIVADNALKGMHDFVTGGNKKDLHLKQVNMDRDFRIDLFGDLRTILPKDRCPRCNANIEFGRGIEVGHIFKLGTKYSQALNAVFLNEEGKEQPIIMGCYGIGVSRIVAAAIEQNNDKDGIIFPVPIAPFEITILPLQMHDAAVVEAAEKIHEDLSELGLDVLLDDRDERAGVKFKDADLLGIPLRITVGSRGIKTGTVEVKGRTEAENEQIPMVDVISHMKERVEALYDSLN
jgi:prolyl-tRNA synthetase